MTQAFVEAGVPAEAISIYPGQGDIGAAVLGHCPRNLIFGGTPTVDRYRADPRVQAHGPGFSKIILGDDKVDQWEDYLDLMVDSVLVNSGRSCIKLFGNLGLPSHPGNRRGPGRAPGTGGAPAASGPESPLAAFTVPGWPGLFPRTSTTAWPPVARKM